MKKLLALACVVMLSGCAITGPAEDQWDREEKEDRINLSGIFGGSKSASTKKAEQENEELRRRIERLERGASSAPADANNAPANSAASVQQGGATSGSSVSFKEWSNARQKGSSDYDEFQEYQKWLEFKKFKEQAAKQ